MEDLKTMKKNLIHCVQSQMNGNLKEVDAEELGEAIDMIKDLEEAIYYATITKAMEGGEDKKHESHYQPQNTMYYPVYLRDMDRNYGRMYYDGASYTQNNGGNSGNMGGTRNYQEGMVPYYEYPMQMMRDQREGRSPMSRKNYMEAKEKSNDVSTHMKELEKYMAELSQDMTEMIQKATPEEKQMLQQKIQMLASKIK